MSSEIFAHAQKSSENIALYLPKTSDVEQIAALGAKEVHYLYTSGRCKALCAYYGDLM
jgi:RNA cap guanine-N2 methyltransferase